MFKTRYKVTTEGLRTTVRRIGKSRTTVIARPASPWRAQQIEDAKLGPPPKKKVRRKRSR